MNGVDVQKAIAEKKEKELINKYLDERAKEPKKPAYSKKCKVCGIEGHKNTSTYKCKLHEKYRGPP